MIPALNVRLCRLACDVDETVQHLEARHLNYGEAALLAVPALHLRLALAQLEQMIYEAEQLDRRPHLAEREAA